MKTYKIKPLRWEKFNREKESEFHVACSPFGAFYVTRWWDAVNNRWKPWTWKCRFSEWDSSTAGGDCSSLKAGKEAAAEEWHKRLSGALEEVG